MKALLFLLLLAASAQAQSAIRATSTLHKDGTRSNTIIDNEKRTAEETLEQPLGNDKYRVLQKTTFLMDDQNRYLGSITADAKGTILFRTAFRYDSQSRVEEEAISSPEGKLIRRRVYMYGPQNKVMNVLEYDGNGTPVAVGRNAAHKQLAPQAAGGTSFAPPQPTPKKRK